MGSFPIVPGQAFIEGQKRDGVQRFQWSCSCRSNALSARKSPWLRNIWSVLEAFRQHWEAVHPNSDSVDWAAAHAKVPWLTGEHPSDDNGFWIAPSGKRPAVESDYRVVGLDPGKMVTGSYNFTTEEEKKGMSRLSDIEARLRELEKEAAKYARFPKTDEWPVGTVIMYDWSPRVNDQAEVFTYAVLKATAEEWYWTGAWRQATKADRGNYDVLVERLADDNVSNIRVATPDDFDPLFPELEDLVGLEGTKTVEEVSAKLADKGIYVPVVKRADG